MVKRQGIKDDFTDPKVNTTGSSTQVTYLLEMACNEIFGNFVEGFNSKIDMLKEF